MTRLLAILLIAMSLQACTTSELGYRCASAPEGWAKGAVDTDYLNSLLELDFVNPPNNFLEAGQVTWHISPDKTKYWACQAGYNKSNCGESGYMFSPDKNDYANHNGAQVIDTIILCGYH